MLVRTEKGLFVLAGSPGNNFAQAGTCRYDSSLGNNLLHKLVLFHGKYFFFVLVKKPSFNDLI